MSVEQTTMIEGAPFAYRHTEADVGVLHQVFVDKSYALDRFRLWPQISEYYGVAAEASQPLIVDCGANIGASPLWFALQFPEARIVAIEPERENFELLRRNLAGHTNVRPLQAAVASASGSVPLYDPGWGAWGFRTETVRPDVPVVAEVAAVSVEDVLRAERGTAPFVLKVDIEGAEGELFSRNTAVFSAFPVVIVELHDWMRPGEGTSDSFLRWHVAEGRDFVHHGENVFSLARWLAAPETIGYAA